MNTTQFVAVIVVNAALVLILAVLVFAEGRSDFNRATRDDLAFRRYADNSLDLFDDPAEEAHR